MQTAQNYQVLARRYRPQRFADVVGQEAVVTTLKNAIRFQKVAHAYLFSGSRGIGKTTLARLFAKALNCQALGTDYEPCNECASCLEIMRGQSLDVLEIDGASNRGIDDIRQINETVSYAPSHGRYKIYLIDEVHMLTKEAFNALLKTLEEPPGQAKFFFATTESHKVPATILSRCQRFDLGRLKASQIIAKLEEIASDLKRSVESEALHLIAHFSEGSLRDAESLFDQILCLEVGAVTAEHVRKALGLLPRDHFFSLDQAFAQGNLSFAYDLVEELYTSGKDLFRFFDQLVEHYRCLLLCKTKKEGAESFLPPELFASYMQAALHYTTAQTLYALEYLLRSEPDLQRSPYPRVSLETYLLHLIRSRQRIPPEVLLRHLSEIEQKANANPSMKEALSLTAEVSPIAASPTVALQTPTPPAESSPVEAVAVPPQAPQLVEAPFHPLFASQAPPLLPDTNLPFQRKNKYDAPQAFGPAPSLPPENKTKPTQHQSYYDTLIRFAAVELEATEKGD